MDRIAIWLYCVAIVSFIVSIVAGFALRGAVREHSPDTTTGMRALRKSKGKCFGPKVARLYMLANGAVILGMFALLGGLLSAN